jgi:hypothetical protein
MANSDHAAASHGGKLIMTIIRRFNPSTALLLLLALLTACSSGSSPEGSGAYTKAVGAADEGSAIQTLRTIATAQTQAKTMRGAYGDFMTLTQAGLLDPRFASAVPNLRGYRFTMTATESDFSVTADPQATETNPTTGVRHFYLDSSDNAIHVNSTQTASKKDPLLSAL